MVVKRKAAEEAIEHPSKKKKEITSLQDLESGSESGSESESEGSESADEQTNDEPQQTTKQQTKKQLTSQDVQVARETAEMYKSNVFKMQIDELLKELKLEDKKCKQVERTLFEINNSLQQIPESSKQYTIDQVSKIAGKVSIPFPDPKPDSSVNYKFQFTRPDDINVVGSYSLKTSVYQPEGVEIDLWVGMPSELFTEKDYLNYRYYHKRAFYVAMLANYINKSEIGGKVRYSYFKDDPLRPIVAIKLDNSFTINVLVGVAGKVFEPRKLGPDRNCVRLSGESSDPGHVVPTPLYNSGILVDTTHQYYLKYLHTAAKQCEGFSDACKLGRLWLRQRGFGSSPRLGGFGHFEFAMLMAVLLRNSKVLLNGYSSYQLFKSTLTYIATDFGKKGVTFEGSNVQLSHGDMYGFPALCFDKDNHLNIFYNVSGWSCGLLRHEAAVTADMLSDVVKDRFDAIFMRDVSLSHLRFDINFSISYENGNFLPADKIKYASYRHFLVEKLYRGLTRGYGNRIKQIAFFDDSTRSWNLSKRKPSENNRDIQVGLILDPATCDDILTKGPKAEQEKESEKFRRFWGTASELRRFTSGDIMEVVEWTVSPSKPVVISIGEYLLKLHFSDAECQLNFDNSTYKYLPVANVPATKAGSVTSVQLFRAKTNSFQKLANSIQNIDKLPLLVRSVLPCSSSLRYSSVHQPLPYDLTGDDAVASGIIEFETSSRWPDQFEACEKTKIAFLLKLAEELEKTSKYTAFVGVETFIEVETGFLRVHTPEGFMFKLRVKTDRDELLVQKLEKNADEKLEHYKKKYTYAVSHTQMVYRMASKFPFYSPTVRLLKQWFNSQLLLGKVQEEAIELLALVPFVDSSPYEPPSSPVTAFNRIVEFLGRWDWRDDAIILDVESPQDDNDQNEDHLISSAEGLNMPNAEYANLAASFTARRTIDQALTQAPWFVASSVDKSGIAWTQQIPKAEVGKLIAARVTALARAAAQSQLDQDYDAEMIFTPSLDDYSVVVHTVDPHGDDSSKAYKNLSLNQQFPPLEKCVDSDARVVDAFFETLTREFGHELILFKGGNTSNSRRPKHEAIGAIWQRDIESTKKFKVNLPYNTIPVNGTDVKLNKKAVIEHINRLGGDMIYDIK